MDAGACISRLGAVFRDEKAITPALQPGLKYSAEHSVIVGDEHMKIRTIPRSFLRTERRQLTSNLCPAPEDAAKIFPDLGSRDAMIAGIFRLEGDKYQKMLKVMSPAQGTSSRAFIVVIYRYPNFPFMLCAVNTDRHLLKLRSE